jgi:hypothetical protein
MTIFDAMDADRHSELLEENERLTVPQRLYNSEINFSISCFWDGRFDVKLGDTMNGFTAEANVDTYSEALAWLDQEARKQYPDSQYVTGKRPAGWREDGEISAQG